MNKLAYELGQKVAKEKLAIVGSLVGHALGGAGVGGSVGSPGSAGRCDE